MLGKNNYIFNETRPEYENLDPDPSDFDLSLDGSDDWGLNLDNNTSDEEATPPPKKKKDNNPWLKIQL